MCRDTSSVYIIYYVGRMIRGTLLWRRTPRICIMLARLTLGDTRLKVTSQLLWFFSGRFSKCGSCMRLLESAMIGFIYFFVHLTCFGSERISRSLEFFSGGTAWRFHSLPHLIFILYFIFSSILIEFLCDLVWYFVFALPWMQNKYFFFIGVF